MHPRRLNPRRSHLALALGVILCGCTPPVLYENALHPNYGAAEFRADLARCQTQSVTIVAATVDYAVRSGAGVDEMKANACMAIQGWQQAPPLRNGISPS